MTDIEFTSELTVKLMAQSACDADVVQAMLVSTQGPEVIMQEGVESIEGRINFLMKNRHGTPFEHTFFKFFIDAPIFVFREFHRHRIGWSYNEESGRYSQLRPKFYLPDRDRNLIQIGKAGAYDFVPGDGQDYVNMRDGLEGACGRAYANYEAMLGMGIAKEVARMCLPVNIYSSMFASCNARSLMAFLSLRTKDDRAMFPSFPMAEINRVADQLEYHFAEEMPITHEAFCRNGRVCP